MVQDDFDRSVAQAERAYSKLTRILAGIEGFETDDAMGLRGWRPSGERGIGQQGEKTSKRNIAFNRPIARPIRWANASGATSFHFQHRSIGKVTHEAVRDGLRNRPGAARAHSRYVEREAAVAMIAQLPVGVPPLGRPADADSIARDESPGLNDPNFLTTNLEQHDEYEWKSYLNLDPVVSSAIAAELAGPESRPVGAWKDGAGKATRSDADLRLLSRRDVVRHGRRSDGHLLGASDVSVEAGQEIYRLRQPATHYRENQFSSGLEILASADDGARHDRYIGRSDAVAIQPDGSRALITNIDANDEERARFWSLVEKHEAVASNDQMSLRRSDEPEFWTRVLKQTDCPAELKAVLNTSPPQELVRFDIQSGKVVRSFLERQPGWIRPAGRSRGGGQKPFASFHDGRKGRVQYRVVGELPYELDEEKRFAIVQEFAAIFERRKLPFVAVMHAPDHHNHEKNWHFHLIYYDRPSRRIDDSDIADLSKRGFSTDSLRAGMWDFSVVTPKRGRTNGRATPLKQNKVSEVTGQKWINNLREELANIVNRNLALRGIERRVDPRRYTEMGIVADPQEHLGSWQAAAETRGEETEVGKANELRQWEAVLADADARYREALAAVDERVDRYLLRQRKSLINDRVDNEANDLRRHLLRAAQMDDIVVRLTQGIERARSRAVHVGQANRQLVQAFDADPTAGSRSERDASADLVHLASNYLAFLDHRLSDERALLDECRHNARAERQYALRIDDAEHSKAVIQAATAQDAVVVRPASRSISNQPTETSLPTLLSAADLSDANRRAKMAAMAAARSAGR